MAWLVENALVLTVVGQTALLITFLTVSASGERRRTGLILASFAALYLGLIPFNGFLDHLSPPSYALLYGVLDAAAARLLYLHGDKGSKPQMYLLYAFVTTHILAWAYASGYPSLLDPALYVVVCFGWIIAQIIVAIPGIWDGAHEVPEMVKEKLASYRLQRERVPAYLSGCNSAPISDYFGDGADSGNAGRSGVRDILPGNRHDREEVGR